MDPVSLTIGLAIAFASSVVAVTAVVAANQRSHDHKRRDVQLRELAQAEAGVFHDGRMGQPGTAMIERPEGQLRLRRTNLTEAENAWTLVVELDLDLLLPGLSLRPGAQQYGLPGLLAGKDITIGHPKLDRDYKIRGQNPRVVGAMLGGIASRELLRLDGQHSWGALRVDLEPHPKEGRSRLVVMRSEWPTRPQGLPELVDACCALGQALKSRWMEPWQAPIRRWGLDLDRRSGGRERCMRGMIDGIPVKVAEIADRTAPATEVRVEIATITGLRVGTKDYARSAGWLPLCAPLGNPVLDMLIAAKAPDGERLRTLLADEEITGLLLEVVHAFPGSEVDQQGVKLMIPGHAPTELEGPIEHALTLALALRERLQGPPKGGASAPG